MSIDEKVRIRRLIERAIEAGRREADAARSDITVANNDRGDIQSQFALTLITADRCEEAVQFVRDRTEIMAGGIDRLIISRYMDIHIRSDRLPITNILKDDLKCSIDLAKIMLDRWDDADYYPVGRIAFRYKAAVYLDAADITGAKALMNDAEQKLFDMRTSGVGALTTLWHSRLEALVIYKGSPKQMSYIDEIGSKMLTEKLDPKSYEANGLLELLAGAGRCDLVEGFVRKGPTSCDEYIESRRKASMADLQFNFSFFSDEPALVEESIDDALSQTTPWLRLTKLLLIVRAGSLALRSADGHGLPTKMVQ
ncbi:hypothetical protein GVO57_08130 [Sphingomonas changnyeongensis]|uniref:Uncharacterized protein n=1 Tax=Sphingomonas changnyeongensis TaxID=2698679 RepID=A0A7Z2NW00_9SPHN|nr:hypothetical protein [Sphingomonas changnyeongensis]QHL90800.1 hypothetical protein GVO57_08130 [Sphingomonas changnyeongensis]